MKEELSYKNESYPECINCKDKELYYIIGESACKNLSEINKNKSIYFANDSYNAYDACYKTCYQCKEKGSPYAHKCTTCLNNSILLGGDDGICAANCGALFLWEGICHEKCPDFTIAHKQSSTCILCKNTNMTYYYKNKDQCVETMQNATYIADIEHNVIKDCHSKCESCQGKGFDAYNNCDKCISPKILFNKHCYEKCPYNYYLYEGKCRDCPAFTVKERN